jgi:Signal transduction histidine kinase regulating citrate/malate metabolism
MTLPPQLHPQSLQASAEAELLPRLEALLASAPLGIAFLDPELRVERVNAALAKVLGRTIGECRGRSVDELAPALAEFLLPVLERVLAAGEGVPDFEFSGEAPGAPGIPRRWLAAFFPVQTQTARVPEWASSCVTSQRGTRRACVSSAERAIRRRCIR